MSNLKEKLGRHAQLRVLCLVSLPPPVTGRTIATQRFLARLEEAACLDVADLSGGRPAGRAGRLSKTLKTIAWILRLAAGRSRRYDRVYLVANHGMGLWLDIALAIPARAWGTPVIVHHHVFSYFNRRLRRLALLFRVTGKRSQHLLLCDCMRAACRSRYRSRARLRVLPNFGTVSDSDRLVSRRSAVSPVLEVLFLSNLTREKGTEDVLALVERFSGRGAIVFRLAGPAMNDEIRRRLERFQREYSGTFEWMGPVDSTTRDRLLGSAGLFLFPTRYANEAQPLVLIEALEAGVPVIANARGCIGEMIGEDSELLVERESRFVDRAAQIIERLLADPQYRVALHRWASRRAGTLAYQAEQAFERFVAEI
jgi:glycosyltransferase involved in cell wall biosynthesis